MDILLQQLGGLLLKALPTFFLVVLLHFYLKYTFFRPLERVLKSRYQATDGARKLAEAAFEKASAKAAEYEAAMRAAKADIYKAQEQFYRTLQDERDAQIREARSRAEATVAQARTQLAADIEEAKRTLSRDSEILADRIVESVLGGRAAA